MKPGDRVKIKKSWDSKADDFQTGTIKDFDDETVAIIIDGIGGHFVFSKDVVLEIVDACR